MIDENRAATGGACAIDVAPAIADQVAAFQIDAVRGSGMQQHAGFWFSAVARFAVAGASVKANFDSIERGEIRPQFGVHRFDRFAALRAAPYVRLIRDHNQKKSGILQLLAAFGYAGIKLKFAEVRGRKGEPVADHRAIDDAVAIEKDGGPAYFVLSHFVCAVFSAGCETSKCQTTAWNASACGVVFIGLTVGMMMQTSATCAV